MDGTTSVDDLLGGLWRGLGQAGMGRTDSEAAFQEFLKRIPSTTNLAAAAGQLDSSVQSQAQQALQHVQQLSAHLPSSATQSLGNSHMPDGSSGVGGMPRVPSLDFLRQLMVNQQQFPPPVPTVIKPEGTPTSVNGYRLPDGGQSNAQAASQSLTPLPPNYSLQPNANSLGIPGLSPTDLASLSNVGSNLSAALSSMPGFAPGINPAAAAAAAALHLGQLGQIRLPNAIPDKETLEKAEVRRARRMLSNRESARRSRRRKQEHLSKLEMELNDVADEKRNLADRAVTLERRSVSVEEENKRLREENERLRDELRFLRTEITERKERAAYYRSSRELDSDSDGAPTTKRHRTPSVHADAGVNVSLMSPPGQTQMLPPVQLVSSVHQSLEQLSSQAAAAAAAAQSLSLSTLGSHPTQPPQSPSAAAAGMTMISKVAGEDRSLGGGANGLYSYPIRTGELK